MTRTRPGQPETLIRVAFYGVAREDPAHHLAVQYQVCRDVVPGHYLTAAFYDTTRARVPNPPPPQLTTNDATVPRDGGLANLLAEAGTTERRFDFVIATDLDRLGRDSERLNAILRHLVRCGVELLLAPHPDDRTPDVPRLPLLRLRSLAYLNTIIALSREGDLR